MRVKIFEKHLFTGLALLLIGIFLLCNATLLSAPIRISEKGLLLDAAAIVLLVLAIRFIGKSIHRQKG